MINIDYASTHTTHTRTVLTGWAPSTSCLLYTPSGWYKQQEDMDISLTTHGVRIAIVSKRCSRIQEQHRHIQHTTHCYTTLTVHLPLSLTHIYYSLLRSFSSTSMYPVSFFSSWDSSHITVSLWSSFYFCFCFCPPTSLSTARFLFLISCFMFSKVILLLSTVFAL